MLYVTSDHHLNHTNIITYTRRPFKSVEHMNMELVRRWNNMVSDGDIVLHMGDFSFNHKEHTHRFWREQLNGEIVFLQGNHDSHTDAPIQSLIFKYGGIDWYCSHYPERRYKHNLCGHVHDLWKIQRRGRDIIVNCSVDVWDYAPVSMETVLGAVRSP